MKNLLSSFLLSGQNAVSGIITSGSGEALIGANVLEKGTSNGTITDIDGSYSLNVSDGAILVISYTGFTDQEITVGSQGTINISLDEGQLLDELVVTQDLMQDLSQR